MEEIEVSETVVEEIHGAVMIETAMTVGIIEVTEVTAIEDTMTAIEAMITETEATTTETEDSETVIEDMETEIVAVTTEERR